MKKWLVVIFLISIIVVGWYFYVNKQVILSPEVRKIETIRPVFKFTVMADIHNDINELNKALKKSNDNLVILAGDLTINGSKKELESIKTALGGANYIVTPGNHDVIKKLFGSVFGKSYQTYIKDNLKLILIDNSYWAGLGEEQKKWIENESQGCNVIVCVAVMHMPLEHSLTDHVMGEDNKIGTEDAAWLHKILVENNIKSIYAGHLHYSSTYTMDNLTTNLVGAISSTRNNQTPRMMEVEFDGKEIVNKIVEIE